MAEKLSWTELRKALASRADVSEKDANLFLSALNAQLVEALKQERQVKINGLGTFRLQAVAPRKSVDVTTGAEIIIEGYNKIVFSPEAGLKELIEKNPPVSIAEPEKGDNINPLKKLGEQAEEIVDILADLGQSPKESSEVPTSEVTAEPEPQPEPGQEPESQPEPVQEPEPQPEPVQEPEPQPEPVQEPEPQPEPVQEPEPQPEPVQEPEPQPEPVQEPESEPYIPPFISSEDEESEPQQESHFWRNFFIIIFLLLLIGGAAYYFRAQLEEWYQVVVSKVCKSEQVEPVIAIPDDTNPTDEPVGLDTIAQEITEPQPVRPQPQPQVYEKIITVERMRNASRLALMAKRYYGSKIYWPYLYDANKDHLSNPNDIKQGTPIRIPKLTPEQLDTTLEQTIINLEYLRESAIQDSRR